MIVICCDFSLWAVAIRELAASVELYRHCRAFKYHFGIWDLSAEKPVQAVKFCNAYSL